MRIASVTIYRQLQPFRDGPYVISGGRAETGFDALIVRLGAEGGAFGWGEAAPLGATYDPAFAEAMRAAAPLLADALIGQEAGAPPALARLMDARLKGHPYTKSAFDMAAWDLAARAAGRPLHDLLGGRCGEGTALYRSIGVASPEAMAARARALRAAGYRRLQVKVGADPAEDAERLAAVAAAAPDAALYADANGAWGLGEARRFLLLTAARDYTLEQPCATLAECLALRPHCPRPLVLDESIATLRDLTQAAAAGIDGVTLKIARLGGVTPTRLVRDAAVELGLCVTVEDTGGAEIDTAAMAHLSISTPAARRAHTVDFHNWVTASHARGFPGTEGGLLRPPPGPGLGIEVIDAALGAPILAY
jgi:L-alanine-DL-glutamate epimerase-like enolase superfamily enzyme